jgi:hypothetical protein
MNQMISVSFRWLAESNSTNSSDYHDENDEVLANQDEHHDDDLPWGDVIAACLIVQFVTLVGLVFTALSFCARGTTSSSEFRRRVHEQIVPSFAAGALLATTVFLVLPESIQLLQGGHMDEHADEVHDEDGRRFLEETTREDIHEDKADEEAAYMWKFGSALMAGFLFPILLGAIFPPPDTTSCVEYQKYAKEKEKEELVKAAACAEAEARMEAVSEEKPTDDRPAIMRSISNSETLDLNCEEGTCSHTHATDKIGKDSDVVKTGVKADKKEVSTTEAEPHTKTPHTVHTRNLSLAASILLGDACCNCKFYELDNVLNVDQLL